MPVRAPTGARDDLQYACLFPLLEPLECAPDPGGGCDCTEGQLDLKKPQCEAPDSPSATGTTQYFATAYPGLRQLEVAFELGRQSIIGSICARNVDDTSAPDYAYLPIAESILERIGQTLE